jgi:hypothetical protein
MQVICDAARFLPGLLDAGGRGCKEFDTRLAEV